MQYLATIPESISRLKNAWQRVGNNHNEKRNLAEAARSDLLKICLDFEIYEKRGHTVGEDVLFSLGKFFQYLQDQSVYQYMQDGSMRAFFQKHVALIYTIGRCEHAAGVLRGLHDVVRISWTTWEGDDPPSISALPIRQLKEVDELLANRSTMWVRELSKISVKATRKVTEQLILQILAQSKRQIATVTVSTLRKVNKLLQPMQDGSHTSSRDSMPPGSMCDPGSGIARLDKYWNVKYVNPSTAEGRQDVRHKRLKLDRVLRRPSNQSMAGQTGDVESIAEPASTRIDDQNHGGGVDLLSTTAMATRPDHTLDLASTHTTQRANLRIGSFQAVMKDIDNLAWREEIATMVLSSNETEFALGLFDAFKKCFEIRADVTL